MNRLSFLFPALVFAWMLTPANVIAQEIAIHVKALKNTRGHIRLYVFTSEKSYNASKPHRVFKIKKDNCLGEDFVSKINLKPGVYAIALIDDENSNGKLDKNFMRQPGEGVGFSNFQLKRLRKPVFDDFRVEVDGSQPVAIQVRYL
ncbi:MAG: DUF2141 domain-containing protein [Mucilaginibacter polytrichastri]|nr:DUF2141 domain-containing protein [Mucilaginibacter polytrichastri]